METTATGAASLPTRQATSDTTRTPLSSDFETFLRMLTVQMKNQDPLNPIESSDFAVQLATFSGVEQQVRTNELLARLAEGFAASGMSELAGWIGKEVRTAGAARFDGTPLTLYPGDGASGGDRAFLVVRDESGLPVARTAVMVGDDSFTWAGARPDGTPFASGLYRFEIEVMEGGSVLRTVPVEHYARVSEVRRDAAGPTLLLEGGATAAAADVTAVRTGAP